MTAKLLKCFLIILVISCTNPAAKKKAEAREALYPYPQYIQSQIAYVDSAQLGIEMVVQENGKTIDSGFIDRQAFRKLALNFLQPDPNQKDLRPEYEENSFKDLTLNTITFSITTKNPRLDLQRADILLNPDTKQVKYLVLKKQHETEFGYANTSLMWRHNMNFQIATSIVGKDGIEHSKLVRVVWDKPYAELRN